MASAHASAHIEATWLDISGITSTRWFVPAEARPAAVPARAAMKRDRAVRRAGYACLAALGLLFGAMATSGAARGAMASWATMGIAVDR